MFYKQTVPGDFQGNPHIKYSKFLYFVRFYELCDSFALHNSLCDIINNVLQLSRIPFQITYIYFNDQKPIYRNCVFTSGEYIIGQAITSPFQLSHETQAI